MPTTRARLIADETMAKNIFAMLQVAFEEEGLPLSVFRLTDDQAWCAEILFFEEDPVQIQSRLEGILGSDFSNAALEVQVLDEIDWVSKSLEGLKPVTSGRFVIHGSHDRDQVPVHAIGIEIEAAQAFGTGHHGTTAGCLHEIDRLMKRRSYFHALDLGTGTGVLAIAIARLGHIPVLATDIDPVAVSTAADNIAANRAAPDVAMLAASGAAHRLIIERGPYDMIVANILARPLMKMAVDISRVLARNGALILSGLLVEDGPRIIATYSAQGLRVVHRRVLEGWLTLTFTNGRTDL
ncbi:MAG: 50S ribosomal protein L11 methyltransferase [Stappiaceae bacterium]